MKRLVLALLLIPAPVYAAGPVLNHCMFSWSLPLVPDSDLYQFNVYLSLTPGGPYGRVGELTGVSPSGGDTYAPTTNYCVGQPDGQKYAIVRAQDSSGNEGGPSNEVPFVLNGTVPPAVNNLSVR